MQDYIVAARELNSNGLTGNQTDWINRHSVYTHGNGLVVAPANQINAPLDDSGGGQGGLPKFTSIDTTNANDPSIPESLKVKEPRIYYGELNTDYSIVGGRAAPPRASTTPTRRATPTPAPAACRSATRSTARRSPLEYQERNILFNSSINANSKIMYVRKPEDRVQEVAPWLTTDSDPYPAVVDGRITWIVDGYTTLPNYPYAEEVAFGSATTDAQNTAQPGQNQTISYMRNSVKATVDAYDGTVTLYALDDTDPVLKTWMKAFPGTREAQHGDQPEPALAPPLPGGPVQGAARAAHPLPRGQPGRVLRRRVVLGRPDRPDRAVRRRGGRAAAVLRARGAPGAADAAQPTFQLTSALVFKNRDILSSYVSASSDPATYGKITVLQLPSDTQTLGPQQVQSQFISSPTVSSNISLLSRGQTAVDYGNLLTLPVAGGLLYVEPIYIERTGQASSYPQLAKVLVYYGDRIGYAPTLEQALDQVFGAGAGNGTAGAGQAPAAQPNTPPAAGGPSASPQVQAAATAIQTAIGQLKAAQTSGDFAAQGQALAALDAAVKQFQAAQQAAGGGG